jgi:hypothetical protein
LAFHRQSLYGILDWIDHAHKLHCFQLANQPGMEAAEMSGADNSES